MTGNPLLDDGPDSGGGYGAATGFASPAAGSAAARARASSPPLGAPEAKASPAAPAVARPQPQPAPAASQRAPGASPAAPAQRSASAAPVAPPGEPAVSPATPAASVDPVALKAIRGLLSTARTRKASDLHLNVGLAPILRQNGELEQLGRPLPEDAIDAIVAAVCTPEQLTRFQSTGDVDFCYGVDGLRYRANICQHRSGSSLTFRVIKERVMSLDELGLPPVAAKLTTYAQGLVLVTGPLGAGKTTTMMALVDLVNRSRPDHIITIEDPIEFLLPPARCQISQRELGAHTASFDAALRGALREDPDIIVIGDLRDYETASLAISAAETGHLVFASMPSMNAMKTLDKLIDMFPAGEQTSIRTMVSESLRGILCQRLLPGVRGEQVLAVELLLNSVAVGNVIREGSSSALRNAMQMGRSQGMVTLEASVEALVKAGKITQDVATAAVKS